MNYSVLFYTFGFKPKPFLVKISDKEICDLFKNKDTKGIDLLFEKYYSNLVLWADTILNDIALSEDIVQEFYVKIWNKGIYKTFRAETLSSFLYVSIRNSCYNRIDKNDVLKNRIEVKEVEAILEEYNENEDLIISKLMEELENLPPKSREVVKCVFLNNMKYKEAAEELGVSISTVKTLLVNSLKKLRVSLGNKADLMLLFFFKKK